MLSVDEIKQFIEADASSLKKQQARKGQAYYEGNHDIKEYKLYYYNANGELVEDKNRSNIKIPHQFFTELVDQATQYILSGKEGIIRSDIPELQTYLDEYFNDSEDFIAELSEVLTGCQAKGFEYMYARKSKDGRLGFECADGLGVVEVEGRFAKDGKDNIIYHYIDRIDSEGKVVKKIIVCDDEFKYFYEQIGDSSIVTDNCFNGQNKKPHATYKVGNDGKTYYEPFGFIPFFRLDNNKKQMSNLHTVKPLVDDYDLMACGLSNNIQDSCEYTVVTKGFDGDIEDIIQNVRTKKAIGVDEAGDLDFKTVDIPYEARKAKLELDEKSIFRFGMGLDMTALKDSSATTNIAIKAAYSLLDLRCSKLEIKLKQFLRKLIKVVLQEINSTYESDYQMKDVYFNFEHEIMSNANENATMKLTEAQTRQAEINTLLALAAYLDNETLMQLICEQLDLDWDDIKDKLPDPDEAENAIKNAQGALDSVVEEGGAVE